MFFDFVSNSVSVQNGTTIVSSEILLIPLAQTFAAHLFCFYPILTILELSMVPGPGVPGPYLYARNMTFPKKHRLYVKLQTCVKTIYGTGGGKADHMVLANNLASLVFLRHRKIGKSRNQPIP